MTNNDILRRIRFLFNYKEPKLLELFQLAGHEVKHADLAGWLKKDVDPGLVELTDKELALFLNGLIVEKRGKREGPTPEPEDPLSNNMILRKMKIALDLKTEDVLELFALSGKPISKNELSAFFRKPGHDSYRNCMDQYLRNFFNGMQQKYTGKAPRSTMAKGKTRSTLQGRKRQK